MRFVFVPLLSIIMIFMLNSEAFATEADYGKITDALAPDTEKLLEQFGITEKIYENYSEISPEKVLDTIVGIFSGEAVSSFKAALVCISLLIITSIVCNFFPEKTGLAMMGKSIALMSIMFAIISVSGTIFIECCSSLLAAKDFMFVLIPIFAGVVTAAGDPALAMSFNTVVFAFAELIAVLFTKTVPALSGTLLSVCAAGAVNPVMKLQSVGKIFSRILNMMMAFVAGIFVAVLSIRGVIAGAADTVGIRGVRFLIGNLVPVVGSAIGEALNSVAAGLGLIKNTAGMLGIAAIIVINLPVLIKVITWKCTLCFIGFAADLTDMNEVKGFCENVNQILSVAVGAIFFTSFVFIISIAIILTVSKG